MPGASAIELIGLDCEVSGIGTGVYNWYNPTAGVWIIACEVG
jgi:hypothetical protein